MKSTNTFRLKPLVLQLALIGALATTSTVFAELVVTPAATNPTTVPVGGTATLNFTVKNTDSLGFLHDVFFDYDHNNLDPSITLGALQVKDCGYSGEHFMPTPFEFYQKDSCNLEATFTFGKAGSYKLPIKFGIAGRNYQLATLNPTITAEAPGTPAPILGLPIAERSQILSLGTAGYANLIDGNIHLYNAANTETAVPTADYVRSILLVVDAAGSSNTNLLAITDKGVTVASDVYGTPFSTSRTFQDILHVDKFTDLRASAWRDATDPTITWMKIWYYDTLKNAEYFRVYTLLRNDLNTLRLVINIPFSSEVTPANIGSMQYDTQTEDVYALLKGTDVYGEVAVYRHDAASWAALRTFHNNQTISSLKLVGTGTDKKLYATLDTVTADTGKFLGSDFGLIDRDNGDFTPKKSSSTAPFHMVRITSNQGAAISDAPGTIYTSSDAGITWETKAVTGNTSDITNVDVDFAGNSLVATKADGDLKIDLDGTVSTLAETEFNDTMDFAHELEQQLALKAHGSLWWRAPSASAFVQLDVSDSFDRAIDARTAMWVPPATSGNSATQLMFQGIDKEIWLANLPETNQAITATKVGLSDGGTIQAITRTPNSLYALGTNGTVYAWAPIKAEFQIKIPLVLGNTTDAQLAALDSAMDIVQVYEPTLGRLHIVYPAPVTSQYVDHVVEIAGSGSVITRIQSSFDANWIARVFAIDEVGQAYAGMVPCQSGAVLPPEPPTLVLKPITGIVGTVQDIHVNAHGEFAVITNDALYMSTDGVNATSVLTAKTGEKFIKFSTDGKTLLSTLKAYDIERLLSAVTKHK